MIPIIGSKLIRTTPSQSSSSPFRRSFTNEVEPVDSRFVKMLWGRKDYKPHKLEEIILRRTRYARLVPKEQPAAEREPTELRSFIPKELIAERLHRQNPPFQPYSDFDNTEDGHSAWEPEQEDTSDQKVRELLLPEQRERNVQEVDGKLVAYAIGSRKRSKAQVWLTPGSGKVDINGRSLIDYFPILTCRQHVLDPFVVTETLGAYDIKCKVYGGGTTGQAVAIRLGLARALQNTDPEWRPVLKEAGFLERDQREVERKKPGQPKARKKYQWSKR